VNNVGLYNNLISKAQQSNRSIDDDIYYERHHIIPKCMNGTNDINNLVLLTAREHFLAHWILVKIHRGNFKLIYAFNSFCMSLGDRPNSHIYKYARDRYIKMLKENDEWKLKISETNKKKIWVKRGDTCRRIVQEEMDKYVEKGWVKGRIILHRKTHSQITRDKIGLGNKGHIHGLEVKQKISEGGKNTVWINKDGIDKMAKGVRLTNYLEDGWVRGRINTKNLGTVKGCIVITKNNRQTRINSSQLSEYLKEGWAKGGTKGRKIFSQSQKDKISKKMKNTVWMNNEKDSSKRISLLELPKYTHNGWVIGRLKTSSLGNNQFSEGK